MDRLIPRWPRPARVPSAPRAVVVLMLAWMAWAGAGCGGGSGHGSSAAGPVDIADRGGLVFRDASGQAVAAAALTLPTPLARGQWTRGTWTLRSHRDSFPAGAAAGGRFRVSHNLDNTYTLDLSPGMADNNITLSGSIEDHQLRGKWYHSTLAGGKAMGTFTLPVPSLGPGDPSAGRDQPKQKPTVSPRG